MSASAASGPGAATSNEHDPQGSLSRPRARNAPRQAAAASQPPPETTTGGNPRTGLPAWSTRPAQPASNQTAVELGLDHHSPVDQVQTPGEAQQG